MDSHQFAGTFDGLCQIIIVTARKRVPARMIMAESQYGSIVHHGLLHDDPDVNGSFCDTTPADAYALYQLVVLIHQNDVCLFHLVWPNYGRNGS